MSKNGLYILTGAIVGAAVGFFYYYFVGCKTGTCAITSNPFISTAYGGVMGGLFLNIFIKKDKTSK